MKIKSRTIRFLFLAFVTSLFLGNTLVIGNNVKKDLSAKKQLNTKGNFRKRVLVLNAYHEGFHWTDNIMQGINSTLGSHDEVELFINYMDAKRCSDSLYFEQLKDLYDYKYKQVVFDAIIASDDHALDFLLKYRDVIFPDVPVVFCGINDFKPSRIAGHEFFTGIFESYDVEGTIKLILKLHPNTKEIAVISDATLSGKAFVNRIQRIESGLKDVVSINYLTNMAPLEVGKALQSVSKETIVVWSIYIRKPDGTIFTSKESIDFVAANTSQAIYCVWDVVGQGVVGGKITDPVYQGKRAAEMTIELFNGVKISEIPIEGSPLVYKFDFNLLKHYGIEESMLPSNSLLINKPDSFYRVNQSKIIAVAVVIIFLIGVVLVLIFLVQKQNQTKIKLSIKNKQLEKAGVLLKDGNTKLTKALEEAGKSKELEVANKKLLEDEKIQQKLNEELRVSNLTKDKFFAIIAHDLRNPFNALIGFSRVLNEEYEKYEISQQVKFLAMMDKTIQNTFRLVENLLMWSRAQKGEIDFKPKHLNLYCLANDTTQLLSQSAKNKNITIQNNVPDNIDVQADRDMLLLIIRNLLSNAIKFTPVGGQVELKCQVLTDQHRAKISVKDNGIGMAENIRLKLFDIGESTHTLGTESEKGTGLGLMLCKEFVEKHQGTIWVEGEEEVGSEFMFTIPMAE